MDIKEMKKMVRFICKKAFDSTCFCTNFSLNEIYSFVDGFICGYLVHEFDTFDVSYRDILCDYARTYLVSLCKKEFGDNAKQK